MAFRHHMKGTAMTPNSSPRFHHGRVFMTECIVILAREGKADILKCLERHLAGDWGDVSEARKEMNDAAVERRGLVVSRYRVMTALEIVILTKEDRSLTKLMLLNEFLDDLYD
jgi:hypothetical protein